MKTGALLVVLGVLVVGCGAPSAEDTTPSESAKPKKVGGKRIQCVPKGPPPARIGGELPEKLTRWEVQAGMHRIAADVAACDEPRSGQTVTVGCEIDARGIVTVTYPAGSHEGTDVGRCAAAAVCGAVFPPSKGSLKILFPFKLGSKGKPQPSESAERCAARFDGAAAPTDAPAGELTAEAVDLLVYAHLDELRCCLEGKSADKKDKKLRASIFIGRDGTASASSADRCVDEMISRWRFPKAATGAGVEHMYVLDVEWDEQGQVRLAKEGKPFDWRPSD